MSRARILIVVFDALRPDLVTPERMPHLSAFMAGGTRYTRARSTFPTETRVNQSAVTTGCLPRRHGIVGNKLVADDLLPGRLINTGIEAELVAALEAGPLLGMPTLGQRLTRAGLRYAALSAGTPGGGRLINWSAEEDGSTRLAMRAPGSCVPAGLARRIEDRLGPMPGHTPPAPGWISWAVSAYLDVIEPEVAPDVMLLWLCDPDESFHYLGIGSEASNGSLAHVDAEFGRILDRLAPAIRAGEMQVIAMSDHGQVTIRGAPLDLPGLLAGAGLRASTTMQDADAVVAVDTAGGIWLRDPAALPGLVDWLAGQGWCGPVFTRDGTGGTLRSAEIGLGHVRAPDISLVLANDDAPNADGVPGTSLHDAPYPVGGGCHGGLNPRELHTVLTLGGSAFRQGAEITAPAGNTDILPTVMRLLGLPVPEGLDGRVLEEALADGPEPPVGTERVLLSDTPGRRTHLAITELGHGRYLDAAWTQ